MSINCQDDIFLPYKFVNDNVILSDAELISQLNIELSGNQYSQGIIGILLKYRNNNFDTTPFQDGMNTLISLCTEFMLLRYKRLLERSISIVSFFFKVVLLSNLKYIHTIIAYLVSIGVLYENIDRNYDLVLSVSNPYLTLSTFSIPSNDVPISINIIPLIQTICYVSDDSVIFIQITLNNNSNQMILVSISQGSFMLYPQQVYTIPWPENLIHLDSPCQIDLSYFVSSMTSFQFKELILSKFA